MEADIKAAASNLRRAIDVMRRRIKDLQSEEAAEERQERGEEQRLVSDMHQTEITLATGHPDNNKTRELMRHDQDLRKHRTEIQNRTKQDVDHKNKEIRSLEAQISKLHGIVQTLEYWHS